MCVNNERATRDHENRAARDRENRATRDRRHRATRGREDRYHLTEGEDARNVITQNKVNKNHTRRAARDTSSDDPDSEEDFEPCGALCFSRRI